MEHPDKTYYTLEEYEQLLEDSEYKFEYLHGEVRAMSGGSPDHAIIISSVNALLHNALQDKDCTVLSSDAQISVASLQSHFFPDVSVVCGNLERDESSKNGITNPVLIVEVLSESPEAYDLGEKFAHYRSIPSLKEYMLVNTNRIEVEVCYRADERHWHCTFQNQLTGSIALQSLGLELPLHKLYQKSEIGKKVAEG